MYCIDTVFLIYTKNKYKILFTLKGWSLKYLRKLINKKTQASESKLFFTNKILKNIKIKLKIRINNKNSGINYFINLFY